MKENNSFIDLLCDIEDKRNLTVIDYRDNCILARDKKTGKAHYIYEVSSDMSFDFSLLCEVGKPYQHTFKKLMSEAKLYPVPTETDTDFYEVLQAK